MYVADAVVVDKLVKALSAQTQLETVEVELAGLPNSDGIQVPIDFDFDSDEHLAPYYALEADTEDYKLTSGITARMFHPAWLSLCRFVEGSNMFRLRSAVTITTSVAALTAITKGGSVTVKLQHAGVQPSYFHTKPMKRLSKRFKKVVCGASSRENACRPQLF